MEVKDEDMYQKHHRQVNRSVNLGNYVRNFIRVYLVRMLTLRLAEVQQRAQLHNIQHRGP
jgi:hypothetical protein